MNTKILLVAATYEELQPLFVQAGGERASLLCLPDLDILITGAGIAATAFALGRQLHTPYRLILNAGIAGSFTRQIPLGSVVHVTGDTFSELGAEDGDMFIPIDTLGFGKCTYTPPPVSHPDIDSLPKVQGITVNTVHGDEASIARISRRLKAQTESMEGAAVFYAAEQSGIPVLQIRSISNYIEKRNRDNWETGLAIRHLNQWLIKFLGI